ncbi:MAG: SGNH/GDSL hydrolase family protein [Victivallaceae bacterium]|nr:SGNH/GDSL hydrolase family protein [Victivallaceae bacterium]
MKIEDGQRLVFIGDSVTDMGRTRNADAPSEGLFEPLGKGYPHVVSGLLNAVYPERCIRITNVGDSGNTVRDLAARWERDVIGLKPDWLSVMIGINDVWRQFDTPQIPEAQVGVAEYKQTLRGLIVKTKPLLPGGLVLMTPYFIEPNRADAMRARMDEYGAVCAEIAQECGVIFVDTQAEFDRVLKYCHSGYITWDRVHPNIYGATLLARAFLKAVEFDYNR